MCSSSSCSGLGQLTSSSSSIRSSYSIPSAFISPIASPRAWCSCAPSTGRGSSRVASITETTSSAYVGSLGVEGVEDRQRVRRQRLVQREVELQPLDQPDPAPVRARRLDQLDHTGGEQRPVLRGSQPHQPQLRARVLVVVAQQPPHRRGRVAGRAITLSSIAWLTRIRETSGSGSAATSRSKVSSVQVTWPSGAFLRCTRLSFFGSSPAFSTSRAFSTTWSGACTTTVPGGVEAGPAPPGPRSGGTHAP